MQIKLIHKISKQIPFGVTEFLGGAKVIPLVYHTAGNARDMPYVKELYTVFTPEEFENDLDFMLNKFVPIDLEGIVKYKNTNKLPGNKKYFFLSFDDGLRQCSDSIVPILEKKGVPATFFINTGFVGNNAFLHRFKVVLIAQAIRKDKTDRLKNKLEEYTGMQFTCRYKAAKHVMNLRYPQLSAIFEISNQLELDIDDQLREFKPYMSHDEIQSLVKKGFTIGAHSIDHPEYFLLSEEEQLQQTITSIQSVDEWFSPRYKVFAFPFTDVGVNNSFFEKLQQRCNPDLTFGCSGLKNDKIATNVHRIPMDDFGLRAEERLRSEFLHHSLKGLIGKNTFNRK
jgi:peptidoglycan/xylan/chitin deacetylase (PgdA/CDA1 family)